MDHSKIIDTFETYQAGNEAALSMVCMDGYVKAVEWVSSTL